MYINIYGDSNGDGCIYSIMASSGSKCIQISIDWNVKRFEWIQMYEDKSENRRWAFCVSVRHSGCIYSIKAWNGSKCIQIWKDLNAKRFEWIQMCEDESDNRRWALCVNVRLGLIHLLNYGFKWI